MECFNEIIRVEVIPGNPLVMHIVVAFPLDQVLGASIADVGVQDPFDFVVFLAVYKDQVCRRKLSSSRNGSAGIGKSFTTRKTGWSRASEGGSLTRYAPIPTASKTLKGLR